MSIQLKGNDNSSFSDDVEIGSGNITLKAADGSASFAGGDVNIDSSGRLLVGTSIARDKLFNGSTVFNIPQLQSETAQQGQVNRLLVTGNNGTVPPNSASELILARSYGTTLNSYTAVTSADSHLGAISFQGADGTEFVEAASIKCYTDAACGANDMPGRLVFSTTADGASSPTERMKIDRNGELVVPGAYTNTTAIAPNGYVFNDGAIGRSTSSAKYKSEIESIQDSYSDAILQCRPVWYRSTCKKDNSQWGWWGFIAEEVATVDPRLVHWKTTDQVVQENGSIEHVPCDPEPDGVAYDRFVPHLLNLIKRQGKAIAELQAEVQSLKGGQS